MLWKKETDFVRMAVKLGALIVPFAVLGADDAYDVRHPVVYLLSITWEILHGEIQRVGGSSECVLSTGEHGCRSLTTRTTCWARLSRRW